MLPMTRAMGMTADRRRMTPLGPGLGSGLGPGLGQGLGPLGPSPSSGHSSSSRSRSRRDNNDNDNDNNEDDNNNEDDMVMLMGTWSSEKHDYLVDLPNHHPHSSSSSSLAQLPSRSLASSVSAKRSAKEDVHLDLDNLLPAGTKGGNLKHQVI